MVVIQCPHCGDDIELEDGVFGLFDCPHCDEEFTWEDDDYDEGFSMSPSSYMIIVGICMLLVAVMVGFSFDSIEGIFASVVIFGVGIGVLFTAVIMKFLRK